MTQPSNEPAIRAEALGRLERATALQALKVLQALKNPGMKPLLTELEKIVNGTATSPAPTVAQPAARSKKTVRVTYAPSGKPAAPATPRLVDLTAAQVRDQLYPLAAIGRASLKKLNGDRE